MVSPLFDHNDFDVFQVEGLEGRMQALIAQVRPKLHTYGELIAPMWSELTGEPMYAHVAKHARRKVNPPKDTWVAWACNPRGYKALPHLQLGLWETHLFLQLAIIYECPTKATIGQVLTELLPDLRKTLPADYRWSDNHMQPQAHLHGELDDSSISKMISRLSTVKNSELLIGIHIQRDDVILQDEVRWMERIQSTLQTLAPIYRQMANA